LLAAPESAEPQQQDIQFRDEAIFLSTCHHPMQLCSDFGSAVRALVDLGDPIFAFSSGAIPRELGNILEQADIALAQQTHASANLL